MNRVVLVFLFVGMLCGCTTTAPPPTVVFTTPTATATKTPTPLPPTASPTMPVPLSPAGPWLLFQHSLGAGEGDEVILTNLNGSGSTRLDLPALHEPLVISPDGKHAAVRVTDPTLPLVTQVSTASLWVLSLPGGRVLRRISLVGETARSWLAENPPDAHQGLSTTILGAPFLWSPDGQYLAFSGALDGQSSDLYLYIPAKGETLRLTDGSKQTVVLGWSPDSRWILHEANLFYQPEDRVVYSTWAASVDGDVKHLQYGPFNQHPIIGWLSPSKLLTYTQTDTGSSDELRTVDLETGRTRFIYDQPFLEAAYDPRSQVILLNLQRVDFASAEVNPGIYSLDDETYELKLLFPGLFSGLSWQPAWEWFTAVQDNTSLDIFNDSGQTFCSLPFPEGGRLDFSPDHRWLVVSSPESATLYSAGCNPKASFGAPGELLWLPDSAGMYYYQHTDDGTMTIQRFLKATGWQAEELETNLPDYGNPTLIAP